MGPGVLTIQQTLLLIVSWTEQTTHKPEVNKQFSVTKHFQTSDIKEDFKSCWCPDWTQCMIKCCDVAGMVSINNLTVISVYRVFMIIEKVTPITKSRTQNTVCRYYQCNDGSPVSARGLSPGCWRRPPGCWARCTRCPPPPGSGADTPSWRTAWGGSLGAGSKTPAFYGICEAKKCFLRSELAGDMMLWLMFRKLTSRSTWKLLKHNFHPTIFSALSA